MFFEECESGRNSSMSLLKKKSVSCKVQEIKMKLRFYECKWRSDEKKVSTNVPMLIIYMIQLSLLGFFLITGRQLGCLPEFEVIP